MDADIIAQAVAELMNENMLRALLFVVGAAVLTHFALMAFACHGAHVKTVDAVLITACGGLGMGLVVAAALGTTWHMLELSAGLSAALVAFVLRLWCLGFHVSQFLRERHPCK
jgi:hypothetical protein